MATIVKRNNRSQNEIRQGLGLSSGPGANTVYQQSQVPVHPTSGGLDAPAGWYNTGESLSGILGNGISMAKSAISGGLTDTFNNVKKTVNDYKGVSSSSSTKSAAAPATTFERQPFQWGADTSEYYDLMKETEDDRPDAFRSRYEGAIQNILDGILNRKSFDVGTDANYQQLYNQYAQQYQQQANRAMRDTMGAMQAATGGYGSTAATAAAGQAYDRSMEGLNNNNMALMQLAYGMYQDENADRYNQLSAVNGLDQSDYARYRDTVNDWQTDRNYYANQFQNMYGNDRNEYQYDTSMDWNQYTDALNREWQEKTYNEEFDYKKERDAKSDYDDAFNLAYKMASSGQQVPSHYAAMLDQADVDQLNALAAQMAALKLAGGSGGGGGGRGRRGGGGKGSGDADESLLTADQLAEAEAFQDTIANNSDDAFNRALFYSGKGYNDQQVTDMLIQYGYSDQAISDAMNRLRPAQGVQKIKGFRNKVMNNVVKSASKG